MKARRVTVTLEIETCQSLSQLRRAAIWAHLSGMRVLQAQANVIQALKRGKK